jgi:cytochrome P450
MACHYLANDQAWQDRLREEMRSLGKPALEYDDLGNNVPDLDHCFKEVLRMNPPVPMLMRRTVNEVEVGGYLLQPHTMVQISPLYVQRMEQWWTNPHQFDPDRFAREEHKQHSFQWAPFGGGAHKCIGLHFADMLFKCALSTLLVNYRIRFVDEQQYAGRIQHFPFAKPMDDLPLVLERL